MALSLCALRRFKPYIRKFDVTMRDGLESIPKIYTLDEKKTILNNIMTTYKPHSLEIGSLISPRVVQQMKQSYELYNHAINTYNKIENNHAHNNTFCDFYLLVPPTQKYLDTAIKLNIKNISLDTSVSEQYQLKNYNQSIQETKDIIKEYLKTPYVFNNVKLYVSCITHCPIKGKIDKDHIINELYEYLHIDGIDEVCLTDTCGNLNYSEFKHIIDYLNIEMNFNVNKLSLHLHLNKTTDNNTIDDIIEYAISNNIYKLDVSSFENIYFGNGQISIDVKEFTNNLTYDRLYEALHNV